MLGLGAVPAVRVVIAMLAVRVGEQHVRLGRIAEQLERARGEPRQLVVGLRLHLHDLAQAVHDLEPRHGQPRQLARELTCEGHAHAVVAARARPVREANVPDDQGLAVSKDERGRGAPEAVGRGEQRAAHGARRLAQQPHALGRGLLEREPRALDRSREVGDRGRDLLLERATPLAEHVVVVRALGTRIPRVLAPPQSPLAVEQPLERVRGDASPARRQPATFGEISASDASGATGTGGSSSGRMRKMRDSSERSWPSSSRE